MTRLGRSLRLAVTTSSFWLVACGFDPGDRWLVEQHEPLCIEGSVRCGGDLQRCESTPAGPSWVTIDGCEEQGLVCAPTLLACTPCVPGQGRCDGQTVLRCDAEGQAFEYEDECDTSIGEACRNDVGCSQLCNAAADRRSNVGCEYWAVDLDNARIDDTLNAAAQQFAVVVSNPQEDVSAHVVIDQDDSRPGADNEPYSIATEDIPPFSLRVFKLGPREVDGSPRGKYNAGSHTALTRNAYRITSDFPVVAYQFNPLENVNVFSNDASLLKPTEAVRPTTNGLTDLYIGLGWPQTIASTDDPDTNFDPNNPTDLRAFLTLVGTAKQTQVRVRANTRVIGGGAGPDAAPRRRVRHRARSVRRPEPGNGRLQRRFHRHAGERERPRHRLHRERSERRAVFSGRFAIACCCADHLEEQLDHLRTAGRTFVMPVSPNRTQAVLEAGANIGPAIQREYFRVLATTDAGARITTSLAERPNLELSERGSVALLTSTESFAIESDEPVMVVSVSPSQYDAGVPSGYPGGDPSLLTLPPLEQFRSSYVFLTPDKYSFDFVRIIAPPGAVIVFDGKYLEDWDCETALAGVVPGPPSGARGEWLVHSCQLSFPVIDPTLRAPDNLLPGSQNDGVHRIVADRPVGVLVDGFDSFVSYAYAAGTDLSFIVPE